MKLRKIFALALFILFAGTLATDAATKKQEKTYIEVTAKEYLRNYDTNGLAAHKMYFSKTLRVTGQIQKVYVTENDGVVILLGAAPYDDCIVCNMNAAFSDFVATLKKGSSVTLQGDAGRYPVLDDCRFPNVKRK